jgi:hypothetical protein
MNIEQFYRLSQLVAEEIRKQNTNYTRAISPEERLAIFLDTSIRSACVTFFSADDVRFTKANPRLCESDWTGLDSLGV